MAALGSGLAGRYSERLAAANQLPHLEVALELISFKNLIIINVHDVKTPPTPKGMILPSILQKTNGRGLARPAFRCT